MKYTFQRYSENDYLAHYGIKGMKWRKKKKRPLSREKNAPYRDTVHPYIRGKLKNKIGNTTNVAGKPLSNTYLNDVNNYDLEELYKKIGKKRFYNSTVDPKMFYEQHLERQYGPFGRIVVKKKTCNIARPS